MSVSYLDFVAGKLPSPPPAPMRTTAPPEADKEEVPAMAPSVVKPITAKPFVLDATDREAMRIMSMTEAPKRKPRSAR